MTKHQNTRTDSSGVVLNLKSMLRHGNLQSSKQQQNGGQEARKPPAGAEKARRKVTIVSDATSGERSESRQRLKTALITGAIPFFFLIVMIKMSTSTQNMMKQLGAEQVDLGAWIRGRRKAITTDVLDSQHKQWVTIEWPSRDFARSAATTPMEQQKHNGGDEDDDDSYGDEGNDNDDAETFPSAFTQPLRSILYKLLPQNGEEYAEETVFSRHQEMMRQIQEQQGIVVGDYLQRASSVESTGESLDQSAVTPDQMFSQARVVGGPEGEVFLPPAHPGVQPEIAMGVEANPPSSRQKQNSMLRGGSSLSVDARPALLQQALQPIESRSRTLQVASSQQDGVEQKKQEFPQQQSGYVTNNDVA